MTTLINTCTPAPCATRRPEWLQASRALVLSTTRYRGQKKAMFCALVARPVAHMRACLAAAARPCLCTGWVCCVLVPGVCWLSLAQPATRTLTALVRLASRSVQALPVAVQQVGAALALASPFALPVAKGLLYALARRDRANMQNQWNRAALRQARRSCHPAAVLAERAHSLKALGTARQARAKRPSSRWDSACMGLQCLLPVTVLPQLAALMGVSVVSALPVVLGLGALGCMTRLLVQQVDNQLEWAQGATFLRQSAFFFHHARCAREARDLRQLPLSSAQSAGTPQTRPDSAD